MGPEHAFKTTDLLKWCKFSGAAWYKDGFFYSRYPEPKKAPNSAAPASSRRCTTTIGDPQEKDALVWENTENGDLYVGVGVTEGEEFATLYISTGTDGYEMHFHDLRSGGMPTPATKWVAPQEGFAHKTSIIEYVEATGKFLVMTEVDAPNYRVVEVDPKNPAQANWKNAIPQEKELAAERLHRRRHPVRRIPKGRHEPLLPHEAGRQRQAGDRLARHRQCRWLRWQT